MKKVGRVVAGFFGACAHLLIKLLYHLCTFVDTFSRGNSV
jgi:hypothetical protein